MKHFLPLLCLGMALNAQLLPASGQVLTREDSLSSGMMQDRATVLSGYGQAKYTLDTKRQSSAAELTRVVLFVGHKFSSRISLFTEMELENGLVAGNGSDETSSGSISMEQAFLRFNLNPTTYLVAGLFVPRLGFINENHLPTNFHGVDRPYLESQVVPSIWREVGVGLYGQFKSLPGLNYSLSLTNGLNSEKFGSTGGIGGGKQGGQPSEGTNTAVNAALLYYVGDFRVQLSGYFGGSTALEKRVADSLQLDGGMFGNPVSIGEMNVQYRKGPWEARAMGAYIHVQNAAAINRAYANNTPEELYGAYGELAYDLWHRKYRGEKAFSLFCRYEWMDLSGKIPPNGIQNAANQKQYLLGGVSIRPTRGVVVKADYTYRATGDYNPALIVTPFPQMVPYFKENGFVNVGVGYNF